MSEPIQPPGLVTQGLSACEAGSAQQRHVAQPSVGPNRFKTFCCAGILLASIEVMRMIRKGQLADINDQASSPANQFYSLAF